MIPRILHSDNYMSFIIIAHGRCGNDNVIIMLWFYVWFAVRAVSLSGLFWSIIPFLNYTLKKALVIIEIHNYI